MSIEQAISFHLADISLIGVLHLPENSPRLGVILVVGGPQYRVGSHRLYLLLARYLATKGLAVLRFDCGGMGDSGGEFSGFQNIGPDIAAAVDTFATLVPSVNRYVLWGLCDATLSICERAERDPRIVGVVLVNPWVRTEATLAATHLRHYYLQRLTEKDFFVRLISGKFNPLSSTKSFITDFYHWAVPQFSAALSKRKNHSTNHLVNRMQLSLARFKGSVLLILSGRDLTAKEFEDAAAEGRGWPALYRDRKLTIRKLDEADHSFSQRACANRVMSLTADWLSLLDPVSLGMDQQSSAKPVCE